ncbi:MAG: hypothetical protein ACOX8V_07600 [Thermoleophilia bacterium]|jgi:hypothetical protein
MIGCISCGLCPACLGPLAYGEEGAYCPNPDCDWAAVECSDEWQC